MAALLITTLLLLAAADAATRQPLQPVYAVPASNATASTTTVVPDANQSQAFLDLHNRARAKVGVAPLAWDDTVASYAQSYAAARQGDCELARSGGPYGENIFWESAAGESAAAADDAVGSWVAEKQYYNCSGDSCTAPAGRSCGHYTQVVWERTTKLGCATVTCDARKGTFAVCEYDPPGNVPGLVPYTGCWRYINQSSGKENGTSASSGNSSSPNRKDSNPPVLLIALPVLTVLGLIVAISICVCRRSRLKTKLSCTSFTSSEGVEDLKSMLLDPSVIREATDNFAERNKLGEGGFGQVYKGMLPDGQEIAVKKLARGSKQGLRELKNELLLVAKLQHRNLVKLIGACLDGQEKLLVYEYIPNKSLDTFIYDAQKREELDWGKRYRIICGVGRGLLYLHEESRLKVIHRDLKPSNILLEMDMNPKISDFGLASVFEGDHSKHITRRVAGTYGYMAPEYAVLGHVSTKSDVFSFGVIILETVTGRRNSVSSSETMMSQHLLSYVWDNWTSGTITKIVDASLHYNCEENVVLKCVHIGLLCVQENPTDRPSMSNVILMLVGRSVTLPAPSRPAFLFRLDDVNNTHHEAENDLARHSDRAKSSLNKMTITELAPR